MRASRQNASRIDANATKLKHPSTPQKPEEKSQKKNGRKRPQERSQKRSQKRSQDRSQKTPGGPTSKQRREITKNRMTQNFFLKEGFLENSCYSYLVRNLVRLWLRSREQGENQKISIFPQPSHSYLENHAPRFAFSPAAFVWRLLLGCFVDCFLDDDFRSRVFFTLFFDCTSFVLHLSHASFMLYLSFRILPCAGSP